MPSDQSFKRVLFLRDAVFLVENLSADQYLGSYI